MRYDGILIKIILFIFYKNKLHNLIIKRCNKIIKIKCIKMFIRVCLPFQSLGSSLVKEQSEYLVRHHLEKW